ncbi:DUF1493 family protein [Undibacterium pigrum]|uniref:Acyl carrier protein n=1 Tax=Undibacterium pigrum TaxID=401470 RepID=A0A318J5B3_9BURK|nr:DUF1493 family protein [Undibacterium pigrum]PXX41537.1 acyl carrier protein [Undibacterium pigrum]
MNPAIIRDEVKHCIADFAGVPIQNLSDDTSLFHDLGMDGDDALEFMQEFSRRFHVDLAQFVHSDYFGAEAASNPLALVTGLIGLISTTGCTATFHRLEIRDLVQTAMTGSFAQAK